MPKIIGRPKVRFNLFDWNTLEETYIILYYQYRQGKRLKYSTGWKISSEFWDRRKQMAIPATRCPDASAINSDIAALKRHCYDIYEENERGNIAPEIFRDELRRRMGKGHEAKAQELPTFIQFVEQLYNEKAKQPNAKKGSLQVDHKVLYHLKVYAQEKRRKLEFSELNERLYSDFKAWLHSPPRNLSTNYVKKIFGNIKYLP